MSQYQAWSMLQTYSTQNFAKGTQKYHFSFFATQNISLFYTRNLYMSKKIPEEIQIELRIGSSKARNW